MLTGSLIYVNSLGGGSDVKLGEYELCLSSVNELLFLIRYCYCQAGTLSVGAGELSEMRTLIRLLRNLDAIDFLSGVPSAFFLACEIVPESFIVKGILGREGDTLL